MKSQNPSSRSAISVEIDWATIHSRLKHTASLLEQGTSLSIIEKKEILKKRAQNLSRSQSEDPRNEKPIEIVEFLLAYEHYGIESSCVSEVYPLKELTPLPGTPAFILGIINVRGRIISIVDLKAFFNLPAKGITDFNKVIIVTDGRMEFGLLVDAIANVQQIAISARGFEGDRIEVQLKHLIKDLENIVRGTFPKTIQLEISVSSDLWTILADSTQIHQILLNLCVNARDAMPDGGTLAIRAENHIFDAQHLTANPQAKEGPYVLISVSDSGTGIPQEILDKIFDPFFTTKEIGKGTGLGLSTVMAIAKNHEGFVNVYSEIGRGAAFNVYLPAIKSSAEQPSMLKADYLPRGNGETILVVDDEHPIVTMTSKTLTAFGYRVLTAEDGAKAIDVYTEHRNEISAVLLDMMMPILDGPATIRALIDINPAIKIVAASGLNIAIDSAKASGLGIRYFLPKPYTEKALLKILKSVLSQM